MAKPKKDRTVVVVTASFKFPMSEDEAFDIIKNKNGKIAKRYRKYLNDVMVATAHKCLAEAKVTRERIKMEEAMSAPEAEN